MRFVKSIFNKTIQFLRHLSREYARPSFYVTEMQEAQWKKEKTCCEVRDIINRNNYLNR